MAYAVAKVMVYVPDEEAKIWSEGSDLTFYLARRLHNDDDMFLIGHDDTLYNEEFADLHKYSVITEEGGV